MQTWSKEMSVVSREGKETALLWGMWLRQGSFWMLCGMIGGLWFFGMTEAIYPLGWSRTQVVLTCAMYFPVAAIVLGLLYGRESGLWKEERHPEAASDLGIVLLAYGLFGGWAAGYYSIGVWMSSQAKISLSTPVDRWLPLIPAMSFVYVTVQLFLSWSVLLFADRLPWKRIARSYITVLAVSFVFFLVLPVQIHWPSLPVTDLSSWVISLIQSADVAHNCFPSSHCGIALLSGLFLFSKRRWLGVFGVVNALLIGLSTLLTKQHYLYDVLGGYAIAAVSFWAWRAAPTAKQG